MELISVMIGFFIGGLLAFIISYLLNKTKNVSKTAFDALLTKHNDSITNYRLLEERLKNSEEKVNEFSQNLNTELATNKLQQEEINKHKQRISELTANNSSIADNLSKQNLINDNQAKKIDELNSKITDFSSQVSKLMADNDSLKEKLSTQKSEVEELQKTAHLQFEKIANKLFEEKSEKFTETNKTNIETLLNPLKDDIKNFKEKVEATHTEDTKQRSSLEERIKGLIEQTNKVSNEANNLATALKGKAQKRGSWGEMILERILESSGLTKDREYFVQQSIKDDEGKTQRLDVRVNLPDDRVIIIDSKVSLIAYDNYSASEDSEEQKTFLAEHIRATKTHIDQLSEKKYDNIDTSLDFTMMFVPIEPAYLLAIQGDSELWSYAYSKRILLVSPTTLIACLKLFSDLWRREWQNKNAMDIVKRGELLYEKFVGFVETFEDIGKTLNSTQRAYDKALGQLNTGRGNMIKQAVELKNLGLKSDKKISSKLLSVDFDNSEVEDTDDTEE
ncbi:MAG: DNA recombination protein RmuC [Chitinophagales bacterium]|nr:DNA recombination protein RmuC [Chitinophagales bacterium]MCZ2394193.1 DNA recombination protein RmuC [Chitinophagales bacterium]